jgi:hypothetical protein
MGQFSDITVCDLFLLLFFLSRTNPVAKKDEDRYMIAFKKSNCQQPLFAEAKDWRGLRWFRLRLLWRVNIESLRIAAGQNLKRLLKKRCWGRRPFPAEAVFALFLAAGWWSRCNGLGSVSISSFTCSAYPLSKKERISSC